MGLLERVRSWLGGLFGTDEAEGEAVDEDDEPRLDPDNVTEVRKRTDEDPAAKLNEVRAGQESEDDREEAEDGA
ncbi:MAG: hypothetical protein ABEH66_02695 [Halobacteriales archaeon]